MQRRDFLGTLVAGTCAFAQEPVTPDPSIKRVLVMSKCHLDVGFVNTQANVIRKYFDIYFPRAIETAASLRREGNERYVWTTGSWLQYQYLEQAAPDARKAMEKAMAAGDIAWHAIPFTWETELMDPTLIAGGIGFSKALDRRFGKTTTGAKMTDVPGHTRAIVPALADAGVKFLDIGVNSASTPPDVPPLFVWKDPTGRSIVVMYHLHKYGGIVKVPGSDLAIDIEVANDNGGPHSLQRIHGIYADLRKQFPNATITPTDLTTIANAVEPYKGKLPVFTQEIGDTWIYGVPSDPLKLARYLEVARLRRQWIAGGKWEAGSAADLKFMASFLLEVEHTWGTDTKTWLDFDHYTPHDLATMLDTPKYKTVLHSWEEKRQDLFDAVATLPPPLQSEARSRVERMKPVEPKLAGEQTHEIESKHFTVALDPRTGAIVRLKSKDTGRDWASPERPLALFSYQTLSKPDYDHFFEAYIKRKADWVPKDFGKPNIEKFGAKSRTWTASLVDSRRTEDGLVAQLKIDGENSAVTGWPARMYLELTAPDDEPVVDISFSWFGKPANRMPEGLWLTFQPVFSEAKGWTLDKCGEGVSPFDVVTGGNRFMHAVLGGLHYNGPEGKLSIVPVDAPVVALGERMPVYFTREQPDLVKGFHFSLFNNGWGTNYVQWFGEDMRFRFRLG